MKFSDILELHPANDRNFKALVEAVKRNTVVPFIGAGMSVPFYPLWNKALDKLKEEVDPKQRPAVERKMEAAANEIERCDVLEKALGKPALCRALCGLFDIRNFTEATDKPLNIRPAALLPRIFPNSPMLTVNLEKMAEEVFRRFSVPFLDSLGPQDTKRLAAWKQQRMHGILYLHGRVSGKLTDYDKLVFSKSQYNRHYRPFSRLVRALRGCMKDEQLLFLGCSLRHDRTLDILNKVYRAANKRLEHFAILDLKDEDADIDSRIKQLENDYGIRAIVYPNGEHKAVIAILAELLRRIDEVAYREYLNSLPVEAVNAKENDVKRFTPEAKNTDFCGKSAIEALEKLKAFCSDDRDFSWWAITAPGGSGKTRMMMELAEYEKTQGWSVRTLRQSEYDDEETLREIRRNTQPLLVISDYAGDHAKTLASWIELLSDHRGQKIRLLLAERSRGLPDCIEEDEHDEEDEAIKPTFDAPRNSWYDRMKSSGVRPDVLNGSQYGDAGSFLELEPLDNDALIKLMRSYAEKVFDGRRISENEAVELYKVLEDVDPGLCRPLYAMFITDALIQNSEPKAWDRDTVLKELISREERHLASKQREWLCIPETDDLLTEAVKKARLNATVLDGAAANEIQAWQEVKLLVTGYHKLPTEFLRYMQLTDAENDAAENEIKVAAVKPDLLGEYFVSQNPSKAMPMLFADGWLNDKRRTAFVDRLIQDYGKALPKAFWQKLYGETPKTPEEADALMDRLFSITNYTGSEESIAAVEKMSRLYEDFPAKSTAYTYSRGLFNLARNQGKANDLSGCKESIERLRNLSDEYKDYREIALQYAKGLFNLANAQGRAYDLPSRKESTELLRKLSESNEYKGDREIALRYAKGLFNLANAQRKADDLSGCEENIERLRELSESEEYKGVSEIAQRYAMGLVILAIAYGNNLSGRKDIVECLRRLSESNEYKGNREIALRYAMSLFNLANSQRKTNDLPDCKESIERLRRLSEVEYNGDREIALRYAKSLVNLSDAQSHINDLAGCKESTERLRRLSESDEYNGDKEIALRYAKGLVNLADAQSHANDLVGCKESTERLHQLSESDEYKDYKEIALRYANGLNDLAGIQGRTSDLPGCKDSIERLRRLSESDEFKGDKDIALTYANGLFNLANAQGTANDLSGCKESIGLLRRLSEEQYKGDEEISETYNSALKLQSFLGADS